MKKLLLACTLLVATFTSRADLIWYEGFNYEDGLITQTSTNLDGTTNWFRHSGTGSDSYVKNHKLEIAATVSGGSLTRSDDVNRKLAVTEGSPYTNSQMVVYASFTVNCTNLPTVPGYFASFMNSSSILQGRVFGLAGTLPGTWRLGVAGAAGSPNQVFPVDLAANTDYQVVLQWDPVSMYAGTLWVNPLSAGDFSVMSGDAVSAPPPALAFAFRQGSSFGTAFFQVTNVAVATSFNEAATAVWSTDPVAPVVVYPPKSQTNFVGDVANISAVAAGQGLAGITYQWRKNGLNVSNPNGNTNVLTLFSAAISDTGNYDLVVTTPNGQTATSTAAWLWVTNPAVPPTFTLQPTNRSAFFGQNVTLYAQASGALPITYQWYRNGSVLDGQTEPSITIVNVQADNNTTGTYRCDATNPFGTRPSANAVVTATAPPTVSIAYLRTLVDPVYYLPTNTTALYTVTGIVTTHTNVTTAANSSFYLQDDTAGICVYFGNTTQARPEAGDSVTVTGPLGHFNSLLELNLTASDPSHSVVTNSHGNLLPAGKVLPFSFTNSPAFGGPGEAIRLYQGAVVTFTNVYFPDADGTAVFVSGRNYNMTNAAGENFAFRVDSRVGDIIDKPIPAFAYTVTGPMGFFLNATAPDRSAGYQLLPTRYADIVTTAPAPVTVNAALDNGNVRMTWEAQPYMSYSVLRANAVTGPFLPVASGLSFNTVDGRFVDSTTGSSTRFYQVVSP